MIHSLYEASSDFRNEEAQMLFDIIHYCSETKTLPSSVATWYMLI